VNSERSQLDEVELYEQVAEELEREYQVKGLWVKALSETENDSEKAKALYIKLRVAMLKEEQASAEQLERDSRTTLNANQFSPPRIKYDWPATVFFYFANGEKIRLERDELLQTFKGQGIQIYEGGMWHNTWPFVQLLFRVKLADEVYMLKEVLAGKIRKMPQYENAQQFVAANKEMVEINGEIVEDWDIFVEAICLCSSKGEVTNLFKSAYKEIDRV
jgi:hypothetical protein